ncbi:hypothetical protein [Lacibacter sp.]|uniref:hypothetical protein n=1 Tax=Lacibacter sp. TaxID=1915409 RepID=UPI002B4B054B|nr:hypothetical protein [Lacibacter sp.]HLP37196.1 hypothetical protein [Lacibacter sp.]
MKQFLTILFFILFNTTTFAQINLKDSTVQAIGYWDKNEKQSYTITTDKFKIREGDTISKSQLTYDVDITIVDSTANSYVIEWKYSNYRVTGGELIRQKIDAGFQNLKIRIKTDDMGAFEELLNWEDVRDHMKKSSTLLQEEFKHDPKAREIMEEVTKIYNSKANIEAIAINDIQQFYTFHGGKYVKGEPVEASIQVPNVTGGKPFDADVFIYLDEINEKEENYILRYELSVDEKQLQQAVKEYLTNLAKKAGKPVPKDLVLNPLVNTTLIGSRIHDYGWVIYSISTKTVSAGEILNIEERVIEIKD